MDRAFLPCTTDHTIHSIDHKRDIFMMLSKKIVIFRAFPEEEKRVSITPVVAKKLKDLGWDVWMQSGAGLQAGFPDKDYGDVHIATTLDLLGENADLVVCLTPPTPQQMAVLPKKCAIVGLLGSDLAPEYIRQRGAYAYSLERLPRTSGAQIMDVLTSQSSLYGYWACLSGAQLLPCVMPMMTTPSGRLNPAHVLVLGAGVAGLQAIATAKRLGAVVSAFDVRESARGAVESLDCTFYRVSDPESADTTMENSGEKSKTGEATGGYAICVEADVLQAQQRLIATLLPKTQLVIATAMVPGKEPPVLITEAMVKSMPLGSVIIDLATDRLGAPLGGSGNCAISRRGETQTLHGVTVIGTSYGLSHIARDASSMYANNLLSFLKYAWDDGLAGLNPDLDLVAPLRIESVTPPVA